MKVFGKELFNREKQIGKLYDFAQHGVVNSTDSSTVAYFTTMEDAENIVKNNKKKKEKKVVEITPKGLYQLGTLNDNNFKIIVDDKYIEKALIECRQKLVLMPKSEKNKANMFAQLEGAVKFGREEIESIIERLENRQKISEVEEIVNKYPHTSTSLINNILQEHKNLRFEKAEKFVPDFPVEAIESMHEYNGLCKKLCGKETVFYVVSQAKDFEKINKRRDPILLAQSPFGFFWQILGAWDEEMMFLDEL